MLAYITKQPNGKYTRTGAMFFDDLRDEFWLRPRKYK